MIGFKRIRVGILHCIIICLIYLFDELLTTCIILYKVTGYNMCILISSECTQSKVEWDETTQSFRPWMQSVWYILIYVCVCLMCAFHVRTQVRDRINTIHNTTDFSKRKSLYEPSLEPVVMRNCSSRRLFFFCLKKKNFYLPLNLKGRELF